jgi:hypothetical protein
MNEWRCGTCGAVWTQGAHTPDCTECGGGAMERDCLLCGGGCGGRWTRAPMDSNDFGEAHWVGGCRLPREEQFRLMQELADRERPDASA